MEQRTITLQFSENDARCLLSCRASPCRYDRHVGGVDHRLKSVNGFFEVLLASVNRLQESVSLSILPAVPKRERSRPVRQYQ